MSKTQLFPAGSSPSTEGTGTARTTMEWEGTRTREARCPGDTAHDCPGAPGARPEGDEPLAKLWKGDEVPLGT